MNQALSDGCYYLFAGYNYQDNSSPFLALQTMSVSSTSAQIPPAHY